MSLSTNVSDLATSMGTELKATRVLVNANAADLSALTTVARTDLVSAINEVAAAAGAASGIDDNTTATTSTWSSSRIDTELDAKAPTSHNHTAAQVTGLAAVATSGAYADLSSPPAIPATYSDLSGTVPPSALPALAISEYLGEVASEAAMLALTGQRGDWATRTDLGTDWIVTADNPALIGSWREITTPASPVSSVNGRTGAVTGLSEAADVGPTGTDFAAAFVAALT